MLKSSNYQVINKKQCNHISATIIGMICMVVVCCFILLMVMYRYQNVSLQSTWQSEETGQILTFTSKDTVQFAGDLPSGIYHILSPNVMEYTVAGNTFKMIYRIENRKLYWGLDETSLECFKLKWF